MRHKMILQSLGAAGLALVLALSAVSAQQPPVRIRGTIEKVDGQILTVKSRDGSELKVKLADNVSVRALVKASLAGLKPGTYVGVSAIPQADGSRRALHVHIFPEAMRGTGEGDQPFDLAPRSTMTNAALAEVVSVSGGHTLTLKYKDGEQKILLPADAPIVAYAPGDKSELKPGAKIMIPRATKKEDGTFEAANINVGRDGLTPPM